MFLGQIVGQFIGIEYNETGTGATLKLKQEGQRGMLMPEIFVPGDVTVPNLTMGQKVEVDHLLIQKKRDDGKGYKRYCAIAQAVRVAAK